MNQKHRDWLIADHKRQNMFTVGEIVRTKVDIYCRNKYVCSTEDDLEVLNCDCCSVRLRLPNGKITYMLHEQLENRNNTL